MKRANRFIAILALCVLCTVLGIAVAKEVLNPQMTPEKGSYDQPAGKIGEKPEHVWTVTTVAAGVDGKPLPGKIVTVVGEVVDYSCYLQLGKHGGKHRDCGQKCARNGQPIGLLAKDGTIYMLIDEEHDPRRDGMTKFREYAIENMAYVVTIHGTLSEVEGQRAIYVQGFVEE